MRFLESVARVAGVLGLARRQFDPDSSVYEDAETGLTFASYTSDRGITYRVAIPDPVPEDKIFDTVLQVVAPIDVGWAGWAWGGHMTYNPLAVVWANGTNNVVLSSRIAYGYFSPPSYPDAQYTVLSTGTHVNETHFQITAKCTGCSRWGDEDIGFTELDPAFQSTMAFAYSNMPVDTPGDEESNFGIHDSLGHPIYDLATGMNADFAAKIAELE
ncbi:Cellobiose dehydrogenase cytochrome domain-containing protein [Madurella fahalii]|uniref:Cellobiose dehydrogenase cytochrome domain-containing protein n=1 Tax=Madurella fahalii TaxID=1157608 RepID=A0ABQ0GEL7_9PEZI